MHSDEMAAGGGAERAEKREGERRRRRRRHSAPLAHTHIAARHTAAKAAETGTGTMGKAISICAYVSDKGSSKQKASVLPYDDIQYKREGQRK